MAEKEPGVELEPRFSSDDATPTPWAEAREAVTARAHGYPPVAPPFRGLPLQPETNPTVAGSMNV
jgi:hypothetical protein